MSISNAVFQGIIQGLTEFLPVSSSGHLSLVQYFTGQGGEDGSFFTILLHMGTLLAVFLAFYKTIMDLIFEAFAMLGDMFRGRFSIRDASPQRRMVLLFIVALLPMAITVALRKWFSSLASDNNIIAEGLCFLLTSFLLFLSDWCIKGHKNAKSMKYSDAVAIGITQAIAPLPGLSRSGSTIAVGLLVGLERSYAVAFSFILGIPAVLGANVLEIGGAVRSGMAISPIVIVAGMVTALIFGLLAIKMVRWLVASDKFKYFAWYTLILGILTLGAGIYEIISDHAIQRMITGILG